MNNSRILCAFAGAAFATALLWHNAPCSAADTAPPAAPSAPAAGPAEAATPAATSADAITDNSLKTLSRDEIRTLIRVINMPPAKLTSLRQSIEQLEKMSPQEREMLRKKLEILHAASLGNPPPNGNPNAQRINPLDRYWKSLPPEKAKEEREKFRTMTREERRAYTRQVFEKLALPMPQPRSNDRPQPPPQPPRPRHPKPPAPPTPPPTPPQPPSAPPPAEPAP